jgi:hypothetical protein
MSGKCGFMKLHSVVWFFYICCQPALFGYIVAYMYRIKFLFDRSKK